MLEHIFTSRTRVKILSLLMFHPDEEYHLREIARLTHTSPIYTSKELDKLTQINLVTSVRKANLHLYSINSSCVFLHELRQIFLKTDFFGELIRKKLYGATYCFIYGSFAHGTETKSSDIDLFIVSEMKEDDFLSIIQELEKKIGREINYVLWNEQTFLQRAKGHHLLKSIKKSNIIMLIGDEHEFKKRIK